MNLQTISYGSSPSSVESLTPLSRSPNEPPAFTRSEASTQAVYKAALARVRENGLELERLPQFKNDIRIALMAMEQNPEAARFVDCSLFSRPELAGCISLEAKKIFEEIYYRQVCIPISVADSDY